MLPSDFGTQDAAQSLRLLLPRTERAGHLNGDVGVRQVNGEVGDFGHDQHLDLAAPERRIDLLALALRAFCP